MIRVKAAVLDVAKAAKAVTAAAVAGLGGIATGYVDEPLTAGEAWAAAALAVAAFAATYGIPNRSTAPAVDEA